MPETLPDVVATLDWLAPAAARGLNEPDAIRGRDLGASADRARYAY